ncbi:nuclear transport factor 2 family protein [Streptomyces sp. BV286]|uniref:nuclear transport factor 2 family protein n=1 Tax=Streptomyces sp. BV286 TaxID=2849672 RepID=UPI001C2E342C|nr:nuclear transport factor 2 family protein [Streptomyces sp. BV286]MBV1942571.1 nuclear transport factor 2 family protein [Streptomyces sp. BV286]
MGHCRALIVGYHRDIDSGRATAGIGTFADDVEFEARGRVVRARDEILGFLKGREADTGRQTVHVLAHEVVTGQDDEDDGSGRKRVELQAMVVLHVQPPDGAYVLDRVLNTVHRFRHSGGEWRITRRTPRALHTTV